MKLKIRINDQIFSVKVGNIKTIPILVEVDGETFEVWPDQGMDIRESQSQNPSQVTPDSINLTKSNKSTALDSTQTPIVDLKDQDNFRLKSIRAPIPGIITAIFVAAGSEVVVGQELLKLEAMKMNNSIRANRSGTIRAVHISVGQAVKLNQLLLEFA